MTTMTAYKLFKVRKDGSIGSLFINASRKLPVGEWMEAEATKRKGFAFRPGWHCCFTPYAPHLKLELATGETRKWFEVEIAQWHTEKKPQNQGGAWLLARKLKIVRPL